jgi:hypothetical protein
MITILKWILGSILLLLVAVLGIIAGAAAFLALAFIVTRRRGLPATINIVLPSGQF